MKKRILVIAWSLFLGMLLVSCVKNSKTGPVTESAGIEGVQWYLTAVAGSPISSMANDKQPHIKLDPAQKQATGFSGCNNFFGTYEINGASLKFGPVGSTRMACPDLETGLETEVFKALDRIRAWDIRENVLLLHDDDSKVLARFTKEKIRGFQGTVWQWIQTLYSDDRKVVPADPEKYTVHFREDGTLNVKADCNRKGETLSLIHI